MIGDAENEWWREVTRLVYLDTLLQQIWQILALVLMGQTQLTACSLAQ